MARPAALSAPAPRVVVTIVRGEGGAAVGTVVVRRPPAPRGGAWPAAAPAETLIGERAVALAGEVDADLVVLLEVGAGGSRGAELSPAQVAARAARLASDG